MSHNYLIFVDLTSTKNILKDVFHCGSSLAWPNSNYQRKVRYMGKKEKQPAEQKTVPKEQYEEIVDQLKRLQAEFDNYRKRVEEEKAALSQFAQAQVILEILPVLDNFGLALATNTNNAEDMKKGIDMIYSQFVDTLEKHGVKAIETKDKVFDPELHEALMSEEKEGVKEGMILEEMQKGYTFNDKVIRCSKVKVAK